MEIKTQKVLQWLKRVNIYVNTFSVTLVPHNCIQIKSQTPLKHVKFKTQFCNTSSSKLFKLNYLVEVLNCMKKEAVGGLVYTSLSKKSLWAFCS